MKEKRFHISSDGKELTDLRKNEKISIASFRLVQSGRITSVVFNAGVPDKKQFKVVRFMIDESDFNFGSDVTKLGAKGKYKKRTASPPPGATVLPAPKEGISFTKQELVDLHQAHLNATNLTLRKVTAQIRGGSGSQLSMPELLELHEYHVQAAVLTLQKLAPFLK